MASTDGPVSVRMGVVEVTPTVKTTAGYDDNVYREGKNADKAISEKSSKFLAIEPSVDFRAISGLNEYGITLDAKKVNFSSESAANYTDYGLSADMTHEFTSRHRLSMDAEVATKHDAGSVTSVTDRGPAEYTLKKIPPGIWQTLWRVQTGLSLTKKVPAFTYPPCLSKKQPLALRETIV